MKKLFYLFIFVSLLFSCSDSQRADGDWDDNIKLSKKSVVFNAQADSIVISAKGSGWWINSANLCDEYVMKDIGLDKYFSYKSENFSVVKRDAHTIFIKMSENITNVDRCLSIDLQNGDFFNSIRVNQKHK